MTPADLGIWVLGGVLSTLVGTWGARRYALQQRLFDVPDTRRSHRVATPRGGGIAIVVTMLIAIAALALREPQWRTLSFALLGGLLLVAGIGWLDDHRPLPAWPRLLVHAAAAITLAAGLWLGGAASGIALMAAVLALILTNVWNFIDGIDGLAASQAALVALGCALLAAPGGSGWWLSWALLAACLGFLPFNFPIARIFMGDVGSGALGYLLAALVVLTFLDGRSSAPHWSLPLLPLSACVVDASLTLLSRILRGERWWTPHIRHLYQGLARYWRRHWPVTVGYGAWTVATICLTQAVRSADGIVILCAASGCYGAAAVTWLGAGTVRDTGIEGMSKR